MSPIIGDDMTEVRDGITLYDILIEQFYVIILEIRRQFTEINRYFSKISSKNFPNVKITLVYACA